MRRLQRAVGVVEFGEGEVLCARDVARSDARSGVGLGAFETAAASGIDERHSEA